MKNARKSTDYAGPIMAFHERAARHSVPRQRRASSFVRLHGRVLVATRWVALLLLSTALLTVSSATPSAAASPEQACSTLGANCICSEPFEMTGLTPVQTSWWNPNDSTTKQCNGEGVSPGGGVIARNPPATDLLVSTDATALSRLPAGNSVARFFAGAPGHTGTFYLGHMLSASDPTARVAWRWYRYYSPDFVFANEGGCHASKIAQIQFNGIIDGHGDGAPGIYGYQASPGWNPSLDCCGHGPGEDVSITPRSAGWAGSWLRFEVIMGNRSGSPGLYIQMYVKNITTNGPEQKLIDTTVPGPNFAQNWTTQAATQLTPPARVDGVMINAYRQDDCPGWDGFLYLMVAAWTTDAGQRIGPAVEVEGGGGSLTPPTGLTVR